MAVVMMGGDDKNPIFHDFLRMSSDANNAAHGDLEAEASLGRSSEGLGVNNSEGFPFHGRKNVFPELDASITSSGRKRSISSSYMNSVRDKMLLVRSDSHEISRLMKVFGKEAVREDLGKSPDDEPYSMQPPPRPTSLLLHPSVKSRSDSLAMKWDNSLPMSPISMVHGTSRLGQSGTHLEKIVSSYTYKDANAGATVITQVAADEGSRTGLKGSGILNVFNFGSSGEGERNTIGALPCSSRPKASQMVDPESPSVPIRHILAYPSRQMTIFYAGQAHVFDDVHPNKADVIMALAGSSGVSWSTTCSPKPGIRPPPDSEATAPSGDADFRAQPAPPLSIPGVPGCRLIAQPARTPIANDRQTLQPGGRPGGRAVMDPRLMASAAEPDTGGKRDAC